MQASAGVDLHKLLITASVPMRMLIRWLISTRMLHSVALKIAQEEEHHYYTMLDAKPSIHHRAHAPSAAEMAKMMQARPDRTTFARLAIAGRRLLSEERVGKTFGVFLPNPVPATTMIRYHSYSARGITSAPHRVPCTG